jgi:Fe2+ transport system protein FeoA
MGKFSGVQVSMDRTSLVLNGGAAETIEVHRDPHGP